MDDDCWPVERLEELARLSEGDPRLDHLAHCPRCRARLAEYRSFMAGAPVPGADVAAAEAALRPVLADVARKASLAGGGPRGPERRRQGLMRLLAAPALWPTLAAAAVLVLAVGLWRGLETRRPGAGGPPVLRGEPALTAAPTPLPARSLANGRTLLSWRRLPGADAYRIVFYGADLAEIGRVEAAADSSLAIDQTGARYWCVVALRGGDEIARSAVTPLRRVH